MDIQVIDQIDNRLLRRKEIQLVVKSDITPSRREAIEAICSKLKTNAELVRIKKIEGAFGVKSFNVDVEIYDSEQDKNNYSPTLKKKDISFEKDLQDKKNTVVEVKEEPKEIVAEEKSVEVKEEPKKEVKEEEKKE